MSGPCLCGDPECHRCFPFNDSRLTEAEDDRAVEIQEYLEPFVWAIAKRLGVRLDEVETLLETLVHNCAKKELQS
jgi:hypothetical protein